jgi:hypothetical protein
MQSLEPQIRVKALMQAAAGEDAGLSPAHLLEAREHGLVGLMPLRESDWKAEYVFQALVNHLHFELLAFLEDCFKDAGVKAVRLKGAALIPRLYKDGERILSDVDVLIDPSDLDLVEDFLRELGFSPHPILIWEGSSNRTGWIKHHTAGIDLSVDVHTSLYWQQPAQLSKEIVADTKGFWRLSDRAQLLHLVVNWVEQDNCVSLNKLVDIHRLILEFNQDPRWSWAKWWTFANELGHGRSTLLVRALLKHFYAHNWQLPVRDDVFDWRAQVAKKILCSEFLLAPFRSPIRYYLLKHLTRPLSRALVYDFQWLRAMVRSRVAKYRPTRAAQINSTATQKP